MTNPSDKCVYAYTPPGDDFPAFVSLSRRESGGYTLTVRSQGNAGRDVGSIDLFPEAVEELATGALFDLRRGNRPHEQRVIAECNDLVDRLKRLIAFMRSHVFDDLDIAEQSRLQQQRHLMGQLAIVLTARVAAFKAAPQHPLDNDGATTTEPDFLAGVKACDLSGEGNCEACQ